MFHLAIDQAAVKEYSDVNGHIHSVQGLQILEKEIC